MPSGDVRRFTDPAEFAASIRGAQCELAITERGAFAGALTRIDLRLFVDATVL